MCICVCIVCVCVKNSRQMCQKSYTLFFGTNFIRSYSPPPPFLVFVVWFSVFKIFYSQELGITFYPDTPPTSAWGDLSFFFLAGNWLYLSKQWVLMVILIWLKCPMTPNELFLQMASYHFQSSLPCFFSLSTQS